jgi:hypothetical protein
MSFDLTIDRIGTLVGSARVCTDNLNAGVTPRRWYAMQYGADQDLSSRRR